MKSTDWLDTVGGLATMNNWPLSFRLQFVRTNMIGTAQSWFGGETFPDWDRFKVKLTSIFVRATRVTDRWDMMRARVQHRGEHLLEFYLDKVRLCKDLKLDFSITRDYVPTSVTVF